MQAIQLTKYGEPEEMLRLAEIQFRRLDGRLCIHAVGWNGKRSPRRLFSLSRDQAAFENVDRKEKRERAKGRG